MFIVVPIKITALATVNVRINYNFVGPYLEYYEMHLKRQA